MTVSHTDYIASKVHLTPIELTVLQFIFERTETNTKALTMRFYKNKPPKNGQVVINRAVRNLVEKTARLSIKIKRGERDGPHPMTVTWEK
jgi:hypothetical protein